MRSEDLDPCPTSLVMSAGRTLSSRVDAPQKPNCRSLVQGLERQGLRRHLPSRFSVRAESRDGNTFTRLLDCVLKVFSRVYRVTGGLCSESVFSRVYTRATY
jgi:hypothetical protein